MAGTYTQLTIHITFHTKMGCKVTDPPSRTELFKYISGIVTNSKCKSIIVNGTEDHVHILFGLHPEISVSDLVKRIKVASTLMMNNEKRTKNRFGWQKGYGAFSYSISQRPLVIRYIERQEEHHKKISHEEEYEEILQKFGVAYDKRYIAND